MVTGLSYQLGWGEFQLASFKLYLILWNTAIVLLPVLPPPIYLYFISILISFVIVFVVAVCRIRYVFFPSWGWGACTSIVDWICLSSICVQLFLVFHEDLDAAPPPFSASGTFSHFLSLCRSYYHPPSKVRAQFDS